MKEKIRELLPDGFRQLIKYGLVGISNVLIYLGINYLLIDSFEYFRNHLITTSIIASAISFLNGLYFNRKWTFKSKTHWVRDSVYTLSIYLICLVLQNLVYAMMLNILKDNSLYSDKIYLFYSQVPGIIVFAILNFALSKYITFRKKKLV